MRDKVPDILYGTESAPEVRTIRDDTQFRSELCQSLRLVAERVEDASDPIAALADLETVTEALRKIIVPGGVHRYDVETVARQREQQFGRYDRRLGQLAREGETA